MLKKMLLICLIGMIGVSVMNAQGKKYGKVLYTRESFKDTVSEIPYVVYEKTYRNLFLKHKRMITIELDIPAFVKANPNFNGGAYSEERFITACKKMNCDIERIYKQAWNYFNLYHETQPIADYSFNRHEKWFENRRWMEVVIVDDPMWKECDAVKSKIDGISGYIYGYDIDARNIYTLLDDALIRLLQLRKLAYVNYPQDIINVEFPAASLTCK